MVGYLLNIMGKSNNKLFENVMCMEVPAIAFS
jgi:hypothetical protein